MNLDTETSQQLRHAQIRDIYANSTFAVLASVVYALMLCVFLWKYVPHSNMVYWAFANIVVIAIHFKYYSEYQKTPEKELDSLKWFKVVTYTFSLRAMAFGSGGVLLFSHETIAQAVLLVILAGLVSGAVSTYHMIRRISLSFIAFYLFPITYSLLSCHEGTHLLLAAICMLYLASMIVVSFKLNRIYVNNVLLRIENQSLSNEWVNTFDSVSDIILVLDKEHRIVRANASAFETLGMKKDELLGKQCYEVFHCTDKPIDICPHQKLLSDGKTHSMEYYEKRIKRHFNVSVYPKQDDNGNLIGSVHVVRDITEIKNIEDALNAALSEKTGLIDRLDMLHRAIQATQVGITICDNERNIIYVNEADAKMHGYTVGELLGQKSSIYKSKAMPEQKHLDELNLKNGWIRESVNISRDGLEFPVLLSSVYIKDEEGKPNAMVTTCEDITEIKEAQGAIAKNETFLNSILNSADEPILVINADYEVMMMNASAKRNASGYPALSSPAYCYQISHHSESPCHTDEHKCSLKEVFMSKVPFSDIHIHKNEKGEDTYVDVMASPIFSEEGKVMAVVEYCHDITEIIRTRDNLKQALEDKEMLIKEVHHRVKNNLAVIQSLLSLQSSQSKDASARYALDESQSRVRAMSMIHERLYNASDSATIEFSDYISSLANQIYENYCTNKQDVIIEINIPKVSVDIDTIIPCGLIVNELLTNAFKYAFPAGQKGKVVVKAEYDEIGQMFLIVRDNGIGLPDGFDISSSDSLGMKIVRSLSQQIGSDIQIRSDRHETEFKVSLLKANLKPLNWNDAHHLIGHETIDRQHRQLYDAIEGLKDAIEAGRHEEGLSELVPSLIQYVGVHFKTEEDIMVEHNYPAYQSHKKAHTDFVDKVMGVVSEIKAGKLGLSLSVYDFLANWLMEHMWNVDMELAAFMKVKGLAAQTAIEEGERRYWQILTIEDDKLSELTMNRFLQKHGFTFLTASTGREALKLIESNAFELIISDYMLPDMNGREIIQQVRESGVNTPVLFLTGNVPSEMTELVKGLGVLGVLSKPLSFTEMQKVLYEFFGK